MAIFIPFISENGPCIILQKMVNLSILKDKYKSDMFVSVITNHRFGNGGTRDAKTDPQKNPVI